MECAEQYEFDQENIQTNTELAVLDMVGRLLAVSLEKHGVEIIIESKELLICQESSFEAPGILKITIDFEDTVETDDDLEITLSGVIENSFQQQETFALFLFLVWDTDGSGLWKQGHVMDVGTNTLCLQCGRKAAQLSDSVFKIDLYRKEMNGKKYNLGQGRGFLVFGREQTSNAS